MLHTGDLAQYRKVGKVTVISHNCPDECSADRGHHSYRAVYETGPKRGQVRSLWLADTDRLASID